MRAVQILMDEELIGDVDREAKRAKSDRSKLVRAAISRYLREAKRASMEQRHIEGYRRRPIHKSEIEPWEGIQEWPED